MIFFKKITAIRNPFKVLKLPFMAYLCKYWFDYLTDKKKRWKAKLFRAFYIYLSRLGIQSRGEAQFAGPDQIYKIGFNARNTQFSSLYLDKYKEGYEIEISILLDILLPPNGTFYDIGSNFGYFSFYVASRPDFSGQIYSFEPHPLTFKDLSGLIEQTNLATRIHPYHMAAHSEKDTFFVKPSNVRSGNFSLIDKDKKNKHTFEVQSERLDALGIAPPHLMKIDTDGNEAEVLKGCSNFLGKSRPHIIFESSLYHSNPSLTMGPLNILSSFGYIFFYLAWLEKTEDQAAYLRNAQEFFDDKRKIFALNLMQKEERFLFSERLNILAVHSHKLDEIKKNFNELVASG